MPLLTASGAGKTSAQVLIGYKGGTSFQDQSQSAGSKACPRRSTAE